MSKFLHENSQSKKGHNFVKKNGRITFPTGMGSPLIMNNYSEFQVNIFRNNRDIRKYQSFCRKIVSRKRGITLSKKNWRITSPTGMGFPFDSEHLL